MSFVEGAARIAAAIAFGSSNGAVSHSAEIPAPQHPLLSSQEIVIPMAPSAELTSNLGIASFISSTYPSPPCGKVMRTPKGWREIGEATCNDSSAKEPPVIKQSNFEKFEKEFWAHEGTVLYVETCLVIITGGVATVLGQLERSNNPNQLSKDLAEMDFKVMGLHEEPEDLA